VTVIALELVAAAALAGWRLTRSRPPELNLTRLPPSTANALESLRQQVWKDGGAAWLELGEASLAFGYCAEGEACLREAVARLPDHYTAVFMHACSLERVGRLEEANRQFKSAAALGGRRESQICLSHIGRNCLRQGDVPGGRGGLTACPDLPAAQVELARLLARTGRAAEALPILTPLRRGSSLDVRTEMVAVQVFRELGRSKEAAEAAERADRAMGHFRIANPLDVLEPIRARYGLNAILARGAQFDRANDTVAAARIFDEVYEATPVEFLEMMIQTGARMDLQNHHAEAALAKYDALSQRMDLHPDVRQVWGSALAEAGQMDKALKQWRRALAAQPTAMLHRLLGDALAAQGDADAARREHLAARLQQAVDHYRSNQLAPAVAELDSLSRESPDNPRLFLYRGLVYSAMGRAASAEEDFRKCLEIDPFNGKARDHLRDAGGK
jgi:tetratricopeptide (TPR) repeat protein